MTIEYAKAIELTVELLKRTGEPLTDSQRATMAGAFAFWLDKAYQEGLTDCQVIAHRIFIQ